MQFSSTLFTLFHFCLRSSLICHLYRFYSLSRTGRVVCMAYALVGEALHGWQLLHNCYNCLLRFQTVCPIAERARASRLSNCPQDRALSMRRSSSSDNKSNNNNNW